MKLIHILIIAFLLLFTEIKAQTTLSTDDFQGKLSNATHAQLLDVRTPQEYKEGHLNNSLNIDYKSSDFREKIKSLDKTKPVFVYCLAGSRSAAAAEILHENGFKEIYDMKGGYLKWTSSGKLIDAPVDSSAPKGMSSTGFKKIIGAKGLVLVDFYAPWCEPCVKMLPTVYKLTAEYKGKALIETIPYDNNKALAKELNIDGIPAFLLYKDGKLLIRKNGFMEEKEFRKLIESNL